VIAGENITVTTNADRRSFVVAASASGSATNIMRSAAGTGIAIATNDLLYTFSLDSNVAWRNAANNWSDTNAFLDGLWAQSIISDSSITAQRLILSSPTYAGLQLNALTSTERDALENEAAGHVFWNSTLSKIQVATAGETFETVLTEENYTPPATPDILAVLTAGSDADGEDLTGLTTLEATSGIFANIYGDASGASNALAIIAGENVTVTTNAGGRSFTVAAASSGSATNIMRTTVQAPLSIATNDLLYTISFDANAPVAYATAAGSVTGAVNVATAATYSSLATNATLTNAIGTLGNVAAAALHGDGSGISNVTATVSAGPFSETIAEANACGVTTNTWTTTNLIKLDGCASLFVADLDDITDGSSIVGLGNNLRFGLVQEGGVAGAVFGIGDQAGNSALWVRDGFWFAGLGNDITNAAGFHFADTNLVATNLATKITTNAALDALSINNAAALTNLSPTKLTWFDLATLAGTNNIAGFWIIGTNAGIRYSIPVVTNTP
jgi:hypothetical protein